MNDAATPPPDAPTTTPRRRWVRWTVGTLLTIVLLLVIVAWYGWHLWAAAVKEAGSADRDKVIRVMEAGLTIDGPGGPLKVDAKTHHCHMDMYLSQAKGGRFVIQKRFPSVPPTNTGGQCDLIGKPDTNIMFEPKI